jgi:hypothetical protein
VTFTLSEPHPNPDIRIISLGAGVQSTVMALMAGTGELGPMPDCAIFADTGYEPQGVYDHLEWLIKELPFPTYIVASGNIKRDIENGVNSSGTRFVAMPFFTKEGGMGMRQCTNEYKIVPLKKKTRELLGLKYKQRATTQISETWLGISWDEMQRMKESRDKFIYHRFPLIEKKMRRHHCMTWFEDHYPNRTLAKSACIACPFHDNAMWRDIKINDPVSWNDAVAFDKKIRVLPSFKQENYVHRSCQPLDKVDFDNAEDKGQLSFLDECEGMCGL